LCSRDSEICSEFLIFKEILEIKKKKKEKKKKEG
jgi:hypothetical protein